MIRGATATLVHTNRWTEMDNTGYEADAEKSMELTEVKTVSLQVPYAQPAKHSNGIDPQKPCNTDLCRSAHAKFLEDKSKMAASPWHRLKTVFLVTIIGLLALWVLVYAALAWQGLI